MTNSKKIQLLLALAILLILSGCTNSSSSGSGSGSNPGAPVLTEENLNKNGCFNVQALQGLFSAEFPALEVTSDFIPDTDLSRVKALFHTHAAFDVRDTSTSNIIILSRPSQADCNTVTAYTVSGEPLVFKITKNTPKSISLSLQKTEGETIPDYRKDGLDKKFHPIKYDIEAININHLRVLTTYRTFDAHCRSKSKAISTIQKDYHWSTFGNDIPSEVAISKSFYENYLSTLRADENPLPQPVPGPDQPVTVPQPEPGVPQQPQPVPEQPVVPQPINPQNPETLVQPPPGAEAPAGYINVNVSDLKSLKNRIVKEDLVKCTY